MSRRIAITGVGAVTPLGVGAPALSKRWAAGESGIEDGLGRCSEFDYFSLTSRMALLCATAATNLPDRFYRTFQKP